MLRDCRSTIVRQHGFLCCRIVMVKKTLAFALLIAVLSVVVDARRRTNHSATFNPSGDYHPMKRPEGSERFIQFDLQVRRRRGRLVAWGQIRGVQPWYRFTLVSPTEKHLKFSTARVHGVNYDFQGTFLRTGNFAAQTRDTGDVLLNGTLRKFVNGKIVMQLDTSFIYYPGC
jgi:hypothetical protein